LKAVERLVAMQAQVPRDPYVALWSRLDRFRPETLAEPIADRRAVRMTLLRGTLHLVTARDALALRSLIQPVIEGVLFGSSPLRTAVGSVETADLLRFLRELLDDRPRTRAELVKAIAERWPDRDANSLGYAMYLLPTVQVTPRGVWGQTGRSAFTTMEAWLGRSVEIDVQPDELLLRYLAAFGPSTVSDAQTWSGLSGLRGAFERLSPRLRRFQDDRRRELFDLPNAPIPRPTTPAPPRFLPEYDNVLLAHKDRARIAPDAGPTWTEVGWGTVLVDGFVAARWKLDREGKEATLRVEPFGKMAREDRTAVSEEGKRLAEFLAADATRRRLRFDARH
ncbi:MAG TPA: winged helix DNA-binding domain-containing protein, partial [Actinomycetota bacterium]|nr:winged helix DNA-binding domain-containing protein [Actinomycetota bacterium]